MARARILVVFVTGFSLHASVLAWQLQPVSHTPPLKASPAPLDAAPIETAVKDVRPASFKDLTPGVSSMTEVKRTLGEPAEQFNHRGEITLRYQVPPFSRVDLLIVERVVASVVIYLDEPATSASLAEELGLAEFRPTAISDETGAVLGEAFPERGVLFGYAADDEKQRVGQILLEPIGAEPFLFRAQNSHQGQLQNNLADVNHALRLDPEYAEALGLRAELLASAGRYQEALKSVKLAIHGDDDSAKYKLIYAELLHATGDHAGALAQTKAALKLSGIAKQVQARGQCLWGDLLASGAKPDFKQAIERHLAAIKLAAEAVTDEQASIRRAAKQVLIDAHLAVARDIAAGDWRRKDEVVPKWLDRADALVDNMLEHEDGDAHLKLLINKESLAALVAFKSQINVTEVAEDAIVNGRDLFAAAKDPLYKARIQQDVGDALSQAAKAHYVRRDYGAAREYGEAAVKLFEKAQQQRESTPARDYELGQLFFLVGSIHALQDKDHQAATDWYEKAEPLLRHPEPATANQIAATGERFVSMGVSYWKTKAHQRAHDLTTRGVELIEQAVEGQAADRSALAIPYANLASMNKHLGNASQANEYAAKAASLQTDDDTSQR